MVGVRGGRGRVFGIPAVGVPSRVHRCGTEVLVAAVAESAVPAGASQPGDPDPVAHRPARDLGPRPATVPTISWPGTTLRRCTGRSPSATCRSVRHTPQARTRTRSASAAHAGTGDRTSVSGDAVMGPGAVTRQASIVSGATSTVPELVPRGVVRSPTPGDRAEESVELSGRVPQDRQRPVEHLVARREREPEGIPASRTRCRAARVRPASLAAGRTPRRRGRANGSRGRTCPRHAKVVAGVAQGGDGAIALGLEIAEVDVQCPRDPGRRTASRRSGTASRRRSAWTLIASRGARGRGRSARWPASRCAGPASAGSWRSCRR